MIFSLIVFCFSIAGVIFVGATLGKVYAAADSIIAASCKSDHGHRTAPPHWMPCSCLCHKAR